MGFLSDLWPILAGIIAVLGWGFFQRQAGAKAERNANRAKEADAYERHLQEIAAANRARNSVPTDDSVPDPYRRD